MLIYFAEEYKINHSLLLKITNKMVSKGCELCFFASSVKHFSWLLCFDAVVFLKFTRNNAVRYDNMHKTEKTQLFNASLNKYANRYHDVYNIFCSHWLTCKGLFKG